MEMLWTCGSDRWPAGFAIKNVMEARALLTMPYRLRLRSSRVLGANSFFLREYYIACLEGLTNKLR